MKGRKPISSKIVALKGGTAHTHRKKEKKTSSKSLQSTKRGPYPPKYLDKVARNEWVRIIRILREKDAIGCLDMSILAAYCNNYSTWANAIEKIKEEGEVFYYGMEKDEEGNIVKAGFPKANPYVKIRNDAHDRMVKDGNYFGLNASSRKTLSMDDGEQSEEENEIDAFKRKKHKK